LAILYGPALSMAYRLDDFAWLSLGNTIAHGRSLLWALFSPQAQGTVRPLGDRIPFLLASRLFGLNPVPFHLLALATQVGNVVLMVAVGKRLLGSTAAGAIAATLWVVNSALVEPMVWASAYNEVLCTFFFLAAFYAFLRSLESREHFWQYAQIAALVLSLATLELAVTFPAIALAYLLVTQRARWKRALPSVVVTLAYMAAHLSITGLPRAGPYKLSVGWSMIANLAHYWGAVLGPQEYGRIHQTSIVLVSAGTVAMTVAMTLAILLRIIRPVPLFCGLWFVLTLAPVLPLFDHATAYYTFLPSIGLAWLAGDAMVRVISWPGRAAAIACIFVCAFCNISATLFVRDFQWDRAEEVVAREELLSRSVRDIRRAQPAGPVFLTGLDWQQFWWGLCYGQLTREGFRSIHIMPDAAAHGILIPDKDWCLTPDFQLSKEETGRLLRDGEARVYDITKLP
jgi:hypothetical protein